MRESKKSQLSGNVSASQPLVSIVTPCYNSGRFLQETIESVLAQDYPNIEYMVMDGGSTDSTLDILRKYDGRLLYHSGPDRGASDAINKAFQRSRGSIFAYLNADDTYLPGTISTVVRFMTAQPDLGMVYGDAHCVDEHGKWIAAYTSKPFEASLLQKECFICQPTAFMRREAFESAGMMKAQLRYTEDYELWMRMARLYPMQKIDAILVNYRMHEFNKTLSQRRGVLKESIEVIRSHYGYVPLQPIHAYTSHLVDKRDQFFEPLRPSVTKYLLSLPVGLRYNWKHPLRFFKDWLSVMSLQALIRRWNSWTRRDPSTLAR